MPYKPDEEVKEVTATVLLKVTYNMSLMGLDYEESDGTDEGALVAALMDVGFDEWKEASVHSVVSITEL